MISNILCAFQYLFINSVLIMLTDATFLIQQFIEAKCIMRICWISALSERQASILIDSNDSFHIVWKNMQLTERI